MNRLTTTKEITAWNTHKGAVVLNNETMEITVLVGEDCLYGTSNLVLALTDIGWDWSKE